jgi:hypothetical protein
MQGRAADAAVAAKGMTMGSATEPRNIGASSGGATPDPTQVCAEVWDDAAVMQAATTEHKSKAEITIAKKGEATLHTIGGCL